MVYKHAVVATFHIYAQGGEDAAKTQGGGGGGGGGGFGGSYIVDHGKIMELYVQVYS